MEINKKSIIFYFVLCIFLISFVLSSCSLYPKSKLINIIVETTSNNVLFKVDNSFIKPVLFKNVLNSTIRKRVENIDILINKNDVNKIKSFLIFNDTKPYYYPDFYNLKNNEQKICSNSICDEYINYNLTTYLKGNNKKYINNISIFELLSNDIVNFFRINPIFLLSYILLFILTIYFLNNQNSRYIEFLKNKTPYFLFILGFFVVLYLFFDALEDIPWGDEIYSIMISNPKLPILNIFNDAGNPPFYYFVLRIILNVSNNFTLLRLGSLAFVISAVIVLYNFLKKEYSLKIANIALFLFLINIPLNYYSLEIRSYPLAVLLVCLSAVVTYKLLNKPKQKSQKYWFYYLILGIISFNTHYYLILYFLANFFYMSFIFTKDKRYKELIFLISTLLAHLISFLPYFFHTALNKALLDETFNSHLPVLSYDLIKENLLLVFGGLFSFCSSLIFFLKTFYDKKITKKSKNTIIYIFYIIFSIFIFSIVLSFVIRPMIAFRYYLFLIPLLLVYFSIIFSNEKNKNLVALFFLWIVLFQNYSFNNSVDIRKSSTISLDTLKIAKTYEKFNKNKNINIIVNG